MGEIVMAAGRYDILKRVLALDPQKDHQEIVYLTGSYEYPWLLKKSLEFALFRTYAVPETSKILDDSKHFERLGQKRYDDTSLIIAEISEHGYDSERGRAAIRRMNQMHHRWNIPNEAFLYVLSTFVFIPIYWHEQFGWRKPTQHENLALFYFWREVGKRMNIHDIPETYEAFEQFHKKYEDEHFKFAPENRRISEATFRVFFSWYPSFLSPLIRRALYTFMDDRLLEAFGYPKMPGWFVWLVQSPLKLGGLFIRYFMPPRKTPFSLTREPNLTYPQGYTIEDLGSPERIAGEKE
jgi:hypothetical protein